MCIILCREQLCVLIADDAYVACVNVMRAVLAHYVNDAEMR